MTPLPEPELGYEDHGIGGVWVDGFTSDQMRVYGAAEYKRGSEDLKLLKEQGIVLRNITEALLKVTAERDKLAAELASLRDSGVELPEPDKLRVWGSPTRYYTESMLRDYGDRRAMAERERAAKVCMDMNHGWCSDDAMACAEAIRKGETA